MSEIDEMTSETRRFTLTMRELGQLIAEYLRRRGIVEASARQSAAQVALADPDAAPTADYLSGRLAAARDYGSPQRIERLNGLHEELRADSDEASAAARDVAREKLAPPPAELRALFTDGVGGVFDAGYREEAWGMAAWSRHPGLGEQTSRNRLDGPSPEVGAGSRTCHRGGAGAQPRTGRRCR